MAITSVFPLAGGYTLSDVPNLVEYVTTDADIDPFSVSSTGFSGDGTFNGASMSFSVTGSGLTAGVVDGEAAITGGTVDTITLNTNLGTLVFTNMDIDMAVFFPIIKADADGNDPLGIETFLMAKSWDLTLGNLSDVAEQGQLVGDGALFNLIGNDTIRGMGGNDDLFAGDGKDKLFGNLGNDILAGGKGNDVVKGGVGRDQVNGDAGNDKLFGDGGRDILKGGAGRDVLDGGTGNDLLIGGKGADKFIFRDGYGRDRIKDFDANNNREDIVLKAVSEIKNFADLKANHMNQLGADVVIDDGAGSVITLLGVDIADLGKADFIF